MDVGKILAHKDGAVASIEPQRSLQDAARLLGEKRIGALLVMGPGQKLLGILSERDIVRAVGLKGAAALADPVSMHMTAKVTTTTSAATLDQVMEAMTVGRFRHLPVVEDGKLLGIISIGDVVKNRVAEIEADAKALRDYIAMA
jgi:CBS domain-containing protein